MAETNTGGKRLFEGMLEDDGIDAHRGSVVATTGTGSSEFHENGQA